MILYHGNDLESVVINNFNNYTFFSTSYNFSRDYGNIVYKVEIDIDKYQVFNILDEDDFNNLITYLSKNNSVNLKDYETNEEIKIDYATLIDSLYIFDTWRITECYLKDIKSLKYNCVEITENGIKNYCIFNCKRIKILDKIVIK